ncbi:MAG: glycosyltransferase family 2 protein [Desulfovibrionaceae bacterium]|nr:glycosyltransferase family 2 protein [Desulfovibrionaceae bacterium]
MSEFLAPAPGPRVTVIIPVFGNWALTRECLEHLRAATATGACAVLVIDNGSTDATPAECPALGAALFGRAFAYDRLPENRNFGGACNRGASLARTDLLLFLNNDTRPAPGWLDPLLAALDGDPGLGAVSPLLLYPDMGRVQHAGVAFNPGLRVEHFYEYFPADHPAVLRSRDLQAVSAAALLVPRELFFACSGFDEGYRNGFEDVDLCFGLRRLGYRLTVAGASVVEHWGESTTGRRDHDAANEALLRARWPEADRPVVPDLHRIVAEDGFTLRVTPWLHAYPALRPEREAELEREFFSGRDEVPAERLWHALRREPLWGAGYEALARRLRARGRVGEVLDVRLLQATFEPSLANHAALLGAAEGAGNASVAATAARRMAELRARLADPEALTAEARRISRLLLAHDAPDLARAFGAALRQGLSMGRPAAAPSVAPASSAPASLSA